MIFVNTRTLAVMVACLLVTSAVSAVECPNRLLWTNGTLWCYSTVTCDSPRDCSKPSSVTLIYDHAVANTGCKSSATECNCNLPDASNDYLFRVVTEGGGAADVYEMNPDLPVQNQNCLFLDVFNVPIPNSTNYFQCLEFRFTPDPGKPPRNIRIAIKLKSKPAQYLLNENITLDATHLTRKVSGQDIKYQLLRSGMLVPEEVPPPEPDNKPESGGKAESTPPVPAATGETSK